MRGRLQRAASLVLACLGSIGTAHAYGDLVMTADANASSQIELVWHWYTDTPGLPDPRPDRSSPPS